MAALISLSLPPAAPILWAPQGLHLLRRVAGPRRALVTAGLRRFVGRSAAVLCSSAAERDDLAAVLPPALRARLRVIPNGVAEADVPSNTDVAKARHELGLDDGTCAVLFLGQLEARKDPDTAVDAVVATRERGSDVTLLVAGSGPLEEQLRTRAGAGVRLLGFREDADRLLNAADVFVLPSAREGQSFALLEAMARGLPLVVADGAGNAETVGDAGVVFPFGNACALAAELERLAAEPAQREELGARALETVRERYATPVVARQYLDLLRSL
jgi:glycosyltransferase involved in cell wall biosynthesis